jgi:LAO/AO transport system kinase
VPADPELHRPGTGRRGRLPLAAYLDGVRRGDRVVLARAITLIESDLPADVELSARLLETLLPDSGGSHRLGITGSPGVGKSTFIDALGLHLVRDRGERVAVLTVDPSSPVTGGSILGDKTRMERLAAEPAAFIRPSASRGHLGGVAPGTREAILLCEVAGFTNIIVETVGVGQSETAVRSMTDFFLLLTLAGAGDELQGIKRGINEAIDGLVVTKADGANRPRAERAGVEYASALRLFRLPEDSWVPRVLVCSALTGEGIENVWSMVLDHRRQLEASGAIEARRTRQRLNWMHELVTLGLEQAFRAHPAVARRLPAIETAVRDGKMTAFAAAQELLAVFRPGDG